MANETGNELLSIGNRKHPYYNVINASVVVEIVRRVTVSQNTIYF